ncbi:hypothetical protein LY78DRAFT_341912 [Colletotrichum sublineola]|nr:hypothetical protein LY78DRAFT_341912 [Colletotrichum sublineola]
MRDPTGSTCLRGPLSVCPHFPLPPSTYRTMQSYPTSPPRYSRLRFSAAGQLSRPPTPGREV